VSSAHRLPRTAFPRRYEITLEPDIPTSSFSGTETVTIEILEAVESVTLNAIELEIGSAHLVDAAGSRLSAAVEYDEPNEQITLSTGRPIEPGEWQVEFSFRGTLNDQLRGFYRSTFTDEAGAEQTIATTQFEAADARRAFPCWDEPDYKAVFSVTLIVPDDLEAISNMAEVARKPREGGKAVVRYADSPIMSTYLVAFVVGPLEITDPVDVDGIPLRVVYPPGKGDLTDFALEVGAYALRWLSDYYAIPYPGDKVDFIAIPDFAFGAMENLGAITYRENAVLIDLETTGQYEQRRVADVIAHELAHMWFGDLVTMKWWDGIWLNEAFASFMEMKTVESYRPDWKRWLAFAVDPGAERTDSMDIDALASTRAVEFEVRSPDEANEMFDPLTYGKGAALLRMIEQYLGVETFREGVGSYLREHSYANTETDDLWKGLESASDEKVGQIMNTWILQEGYPEVIVERVDRGLRLTQRQFRYVEDPEAMNQWMIPMQIRVGTANGEITTHHLLADETEILPLENPVEWVIANAGGHGFYRTRYEASLLGALRPKLADLEPLERFTLLDDTWAFTVEGSVQIGEFAALAAGFSDEREHAVWQMLSTHLLELSRYVPNDARFAAFVRHLVGPTVERIGWEPQDGEADLTRRLRGQVLTTYGRLGRDEATIKHAQDLFHAVVADPSAVDAEVALAVLAIGAANGGLEEYEAVVKAYEGNTNPQQQVRLLRSLTYFTDVDLADRTFEMTVNGDIRSQDGGWVISGLMANQSTADHIWNRVSRDWQQLIDLLPPATQRYLVHSLPAMVEPGLARRVQAFFRETEFPVAAKSLAQKLELQEAMVGLGERERDRLLSFLDR
jgi:puromycin-sensitive aminopeptidase